MKTYQASLETDLAKIDAAIPYSADPTLMIERSGRILAQARYYAVCADHEAAQRQRLTTSPKAFIQAFTSRPGGPSAADIASLLYELHDYLRLRPELEDVKFYVEQAAASANFEAGEEFERDQEAIEAEQRRNEEARENLINRGIITS